MDFYKGYVETKDKKCIEKFKNRTSFKSYEQVEKLREFAGILSEEAILIDIDDYEQSEVLLNIIEALNVHCRVYKTTRGKHFMFKNSGVTNCKTHTKLGIGLTADIKVGTKSSYEVLKYDGKLRQVLYDTGDYTEMPKWLHPVRSKTDFLSMDAGDGRNQALFNYILSLQSAGFTIEECKECIDLINKYVLSAPLDQNELDVILRDESFEKPIFFKGNQFLFEAFGLYLINKYHIIKINEQLHIYHDGVYSGDEKMLEHIMISEIPHLSRSKRTEVLNWMNVYIIDNTEVAGANYIAFKNGIYDLTTDELLPFSPNLVLTNKIDWNYNPKSEECLVDEVFTKLACNDMQIVDLLCEAVGYCLFRRNELRKSFVLIGDKANGKSTFLSMLRYMLGNRNIASLDLNELGDRFKTAELVGKLANIGDDIGDEFIPNPAVFKKLVSGDRVSVERKGSNPFEFDNYSKLLFSANAIPRIKDKSGAVINRLVIIPFNNHFDKNSPDYDPFLKEKLQTKECMERMLYLGLYGLKRVLATNGFTESEKVQMELKEYEENNNPVIMFFNDEITREEIIGKATKSVYSKYQQYCISNSYQELSSIEFSKQCKRYFNVGIKNKTIDSKKHRIFCENA